MIDVAFTPASMRPCAVAVVIDVLRATSSIVQALAAGYERVSCCPSPERAEGLRREGTVLAGERGCLPIPGFDLGNSPSGLRHPLGAELVLCTTNGTPALVAAAGVAERVVVAALSNLDAVVAALDGADVQVVCAGTDGRPGLDDVYVAGRIVALLGGRRTDGAAMAECLAAHYTTAEAALRASQAARNLCAVGLLADVADCSRESIFDVVPVVGGVGDGVANVTAARRVTHSFGTMRHARHLA